MTAGPQSDDKGPSAAFYRRGPRRPPPKPPPGIGCAGEARARSGTFNAVLCDFRSVGHSWTWKCSTFERRLCRRNDFWGEVSEGGRSPPPSGTYGVITGFATAKGTAAYRARLAPNGADGHFRSWEGLLISSVGLGTYLGGDDVATDGAYRDTVARSLQLGLNVIDSAINYRHQRSERSVGAALRSQIEAGSLRRDEVVLSTKGGFIPFDGGVPADRDAHLFETYVRSGVLEPRDVVGGCHCMTPRYLADQLQRSRANLGVETIDVYYLHNPEMQLSAVDRPTFRGRMRAVFQFLEGAVGEGKIRFYGTATWNGYRQPPSAPDFLSLPEFHRLASEVAGDAHHFRVVQLPYNLAMTEAFTHANQPMGEETVSLLEAARR